VAHELRSTAAFVIATGVALAGCSGPPPKQPEEATFTQPTPTAQSADPTEKTGWSGAPPTTEEKVGGLNAEQKEQMQIALRRGGDKAAQCPVSSGIEDAPRGKGEVQVTFDGQKGRITEVTVGPPWAGTPIESCIKRSFVGEIVLPFEGDALEVPYTVEMPAKKDAAPAGKDPKKGGAAGKVGAGVSGGTKKP
jgi:hypothetical protein